jgi:hypothetical protein
MPEYDYNYGYKRGRDKLSRLLERVESLPDDIFERGAVSERSRRKLFEEGLHGRAHVLKAPSKFAVSEIQRNVGTFKVRIEIEGRAPYEAKVKQSFAYAEWVELQEGAEVECRVDPNNPAKAMLMVFAGEFEQPALRTSSAAATVAAGRPAIGTVKASELFGQKSPGTDDEIYAIELELRSDEERKPWRVRINQRVPRGAEDLVAEGSELKVAYGKKKSDPGTTAIDWPGSTGGRFS